MAYVLILALAYYKQCVELWLVSLHDDVIKWKHFPRNWPFVREIHRSPVNFPHKGQWRGALMFSLIYAWINDWVNNREAGDLRRQPGHYDVIVMNYISLNSRVMCDAMFQSMLASKQDWITKALHCVLSRLISQASYSANPLSHWNLEGQLAVSKLDRIRFKWWPIACLAPGYYLLLHFRVSLNMLNGFKDYQRCIRISYHILDYVQQKNTKPTMEQPTCCLSYTDNPILTVPCLLMLWRL